MSKVADQVRFFSRLSVQNGQDRDAQYKSDIRMQLRGRQDWKTIVMTGRERPKAASCRRRAFTQRTAKGFMSRRFDPAAGTVRLRSRV